MKPEIHDKNPTSEERDVEVIRNIDFDAWDDGTLIEANTLIVVNDILAYQASIAENNFTVNMTVISGGYHYEIIPQGPWPLSSIISVQVHLRDTDDDILDAVWSFYVVEDPTCFSGPLNAFETSLLVPYDLGGTVLYHTEVLRNLLLNTVNARPDPIKAIRQIYLGAFQSDLGSMLHDIVPSPTLRETYVRLCHKKTVIQIDTVLRGKLNLLKGALAELRMIGLPFQHSQMLGRYLMTNQPNDTVSLAYIIVVLAKALETNALS